MKKNIIIAILSISTGSAVVFGIYQQTIAKHLRVKAELSAMEAVKQEKIAEMNAIEAMRQKQVADEAYLKLAEELAKSKKAK